MTVYLPKKSRHYHYDFVFKGRRYHGSTGCETKRKAEAFEREQRNQAALGTKAKPDITLDEMFGLYWESRGKHENNHVTTRSQIARLLDRFGKNVLVGNLTQTALNQYVARRRGDKARNSERLVSNATVNREVELMRRAVRMIARDYTVADIEWGKLLLKEAAERVRELSVDEERRLFEKLPADIAAVAEFAMLSGQRRASVVTLLWSKVDLHGARAEVLVKGGKWHTFPLTPRMVAIIANRPKVAAQVFTYECERRSPPRGDRPARLEGVRYPFSVGGWARKWKKALTDAGIENFRFHDLRHTAGTRTLRASGNLKVVQKLLGHVDIATTARYAHAMEDDVRQAMLAAESRNIPEADNVVAIKPRKKGQK